MAAAVLGLAGVEARAEEPWRPTTSGPFVAMTGLLTGPGQLTLQPLLFAGVQRGSFDAASREEGIEGSGQALTLNLFAEYGVADRVALGTQLAVLHNRRELAGAAASSTGLGDALLFVRWGLPLPEGAAVPALSLLTQVKAPLGRADRLDPKKLGTDAMGNGAWEATVGVSLTEFLWPVVFHLDLLGSLSYETALDGVPTQPGPAFLWAATLELPFPLPFSPHRGGLMAEISGKVQDDLRVSGASVPGTGPREVVLGIGVEMVFSDSLQLLVGYQRTLWGTNTPAMDVLALTLVPTI